MVDEHDVRRIALSLAEVSDKDGGFSFYCGKVLFAWAYPERVHPKKARVPRLDIFAIRTSDLDDKEALLAGEPEVFFTTDHYDGYPAVMVRLAEIDEARLTGLLTDAHAAAVAKASAKRPRKRP